MKQILTLTRKEIDGYFSSPMALIFVGVFLAAIMFTFFFVDGFFARGIADVRPLFRWLPVLLIFLIGTLTMRQWSEEDATGTLEVLMTLPVSLPRLVIGKFLAVLSLVVVALAMTLLLPITVSFIGNLDIGPVVGGYLAALLMASAYIAIGLFVSSRTDNQIVALILTGLIGGLFYLVGSPQVTTNIGSDLAHVLRLIGTSSRFESIERGVIDLRDLVYYASLTIFFLMLNVLSLESKRWGEGEQLHNRRFNIRLTGALVFANLFIFNIMLSGLNFARVDLTANGEFSLSPVTRELVSNLQEPLLVRAYFSEDIHPLLEPLVPVVEDTLREYEIASNGKLQLEIVDPITDPELEREANQTYGIRPTPLQNISRSGTEIINSYFDILIRYGDQTETLNLLDLIEVDQFGRSDFDLRLDNLEYDLTSSIQRTVFGFQTLDAVFESLEEPATLTLYVTPETLPDGFEDVPNTIETVAQEFVDDAAGKFNFEVVNVDDPESGVDPEFLFNEFQIQPIATSIFSPDTFYLHMVLKVGDQTQVLFPTGELSEAEIRNNLEAALKRSSPGFLQVVGVWVPQNTPTQNQFGQPVPSLAQYETFIDTLNENHEVRRVDLSSGQVPGDIDVLMVIAPQGMTDFERFAIDQYLMRGGSVFVAAGNYRMAVDQFTGGLTLEPIQDGLQEMLASYGITIENELVMDTQNAPFPIRTQRDLGSGVVVNEIQAINYPQFVDVRGAGLNQNSQLLEDVPGVTLNWASPITLDETLNAERNVIPLFESSNQAWTTTSTNTQPNLDLYPDLGFPIEGEQGVQTLGVAIEGSFESFFKNRPTPFDADATDDADTSGDEAETLAETDTETFVPGVIERSPSTTRLIVVSSSEFLNDNVFQLASRFTNDRILNGLQFAQNSVDWFVEDASLASLRSQGSAARLLDPLTEAEQTRWETINYIFAFAA
ncbi:MAG: ABC transporter permease, partial [Chloroflexi bacterium]